MVRGLNVHRLNKTQKVFGLGGAPSFPLRAPACPARLRGHSSPENVGCFVFSLFTCKSLLISYNSLRSLCSNAYPEHLSSSPLPPITCPGVHLYCFHTSLPNGDLRTQNFGLESFRKHSSAPSSRLNEWMVFHKIPRFCFSW
uniref:Uncharacterized protein n=1 Tax=Molossus molossus TaxID=27622 RepID=A0A7J8JWQ3_MOLMO|nr:hypothetical protein HJG59_007801 [Molossus molossus]